MKIHICIKLWDWAEVCLGSSVLNIFKFGFTVDMFSLIDVGWIYDCEITRSRVAAMVAALLHKE